MIASHLSRRIVLLSVAGFLVAVIPGRAEEAVPPPVQTPAHIIVSGRTSTPKEIKVVGVGDRIPTTYSGNRVKNTPGFNWWVSQHFALKTDYPEATARFYLSLVELAYPHYVELFGKEPPGIENKRMALVYASSFEQLKKALLSDGIAWNGQGGGITFEGYNCGYQYPSGSLRYHQRYILLHECTHLFQYCVNGNVHSTPGWYYEGVADALGHHVFDERSQQLTVNVLDKAAIANYLDAGLAQHHREPLSFAKVHKAEGSSRDVNFLIVHYLSDDPGRLQKFRIWRDEMFRANLYAKHQEFSDRLLQQLFGPWKEIDADFRNWLAERQNTFHYVEWGWEESGNTLWSYGFANAGKLSQTNVLLPPGQKAVFDPLRLDYPAEPLSPLVGVVARGTDEPAVGCLVDFSANPGRGRAGLGLGVISGTGIQPFDADQLFLDKETTRKGVRVRAFELGKLTGEGRRSEDVSNGDEVATSDDAQIGFGQKDSATALLRKNFVVEWEGWLRVPETRETVLGIDSDQGCWLWIDDQLVVDRAGQVGKRFATGRVKLDAGVRRVRLRYYLKEGPKTLAIGFAPEEMPGALRVLIEKGTHLVLDGTDLGLERKEVPLPAELLKAMASGGHRIGINAQIGATRLHVTLRAQEKGAATIASFAADLPLTTESRARVLAQPLTLLARDGYHGLTPFFDEARRMKPDLTVPAPANRWRNPGDRQLMLIYRAAWRLDKFAPSSLKQLRDNLLAAGVQDPAGQKAGLELFKKRIAEVRMDVSRCGAAAEVIERAQTDLADAEARRGP
jgi:hypothetical protein